MSRRASTVLSSLLAGGFVASMLFATSPLAAPIGTVIFVLGDARIVSPSGSRTVRKGTTIEEGESLVTDANASVQLRMADQGFIAVRPGTNMRFDEYRYAGKEDGSEKGVMSLVSGGFRTITGAIGRLNKQNYTVKTPTSTIGIRGTDHEIVHILPAVPGGPQIGQPGSYDKVNVGGAFIQTDAGRVNVNANQVGFAPAPNQPPQLLPRMPDFFRATPPATQRPAAPSQGNQQAASGAQQGSSSGSTSETGATGSGSSDSSTSGSGSTVRESAVVDNPGQISSVVSDSTGTSVPSASTSTTTVATTAPTTAPASAVQGSVPIEVVSDTGTTVNLTTTNQTVSPSFSDNTRVRNRIYYTVGSTALGTPDNRYFATSFPLNSTAGDPGMLNTNYLLSNGVLASIEDAAFGLFQLGNPYLGTDVTTPAPSGQLDHVKLTFTGTPQETFSDTTRGLVFGRLLGGGVKIKNLQTSVETEDLLGATSLHWMINQMPQTALTLTGRYQYVRFLDGSGHPTFATSPTDSYGNVGALRGARLAVNFSANRVSAGVNTYFAQTGPGGTGGAMTLAGLVDNIALSTATWGFNASSGDANPFHVICSGSGCLGSAGYFGRLEGSLTGSMDTDGKPTGAYFRYTFNTGFSNQAAAVAAGRQFDEYYMGLVGFQKGPAFTPPASGSGGIRSTVSYIYQPSFFQPVTSSFVSSPSGITFDGSGNLTSVQSDAEGDADDAIASISGGTGSGAIAAVSSSASPTTGISYGRWSGSPLISGKDFSGTFTNRAVVGSFYWIKGPDVWPFYLPSVLTTTGTFAFDGGAVSDVFGNTGTVTSSNLAVDFNLAKVSFSFGASLPARGGGVRNFTFNGPSVRLDDGGGWFASTGTPNGAATHNLMTAQLNGGNISANVNGQITGVGANGAIMSFAASGQDVTNSGQQEDIAGVVAYATTSPSGGLGTLATYRLNLLGVGQHVGSATAVDSAYKHYIEGSMLGFSRVSYTAGEPSAFDALYPMACANPGCTSGTSFVSDVPVRMSIQPGDISFVNTALATSYTPATVADFGQDTESGTVWGRYTGGQIAVRDRMTGSAIGVLDASTQSVHFLMSGTQAGLTVLPTTGSASYALVGHTNPTSSNGSVGTLGSINLNVDFTSKLITSMGVNASVGGNTWTASATNVPIQLGTFFQADKGLGEVTPSLTVLMNGSGANTAGRMIGAFTGPTGRGAGIGYSLYDSGINQTITGVAALRR